MRTDKEQNEFNTFSPGLGMCLLAAASLPTVLLGRTIIFPMQTAYCLFSSVAFQSQTCTDVKSVIEGCGRCSLLILPLGLVLRPSCFPDKVGVN